MTARIRCGVLIAAIAALAILPLAIARQPAAGPDGVRTEQFKGTDDLATTTVRTLAPDYKPWFNSVFKTPSSEIDTLLFALQAAIGAGFLGYYIGYSRGRSKVNTLNRNEAPANEEPRINEFVFCEKSAENKL